MGALLGDVFIHILPEIVENGRTGILCEPSASELSKSIIKIVENNSSFRLEIRKKLPLLKNKFQDTIYKKQKNSKQQFFKFQIFWELKFRI